MLTSDMGVVADDICVLTSDMGVVADDICVLTSDMGVVTDDIRVLTSDMGVVAPAATDEEESETGLAASSFRRSNSFLLRE